jgi:ribosomal protein S18 acetylase RimI-like enzyme
MDVALLPEFRGRGIGTAILDRLLAYADGLHAPVTLHVEPFNPALRMYERAGFTFVETRGIYRFMQRAPRGQLNTAS